MDKTLEAGDVGIGDLLAAVIQYRDDLRRPPSADSVKRRLDWIEAIIAKNTGGAQKCEGDLAGPDGPCAADVAPFEGSEEAARKHIIACIEAAIIHSEHGIWIDTEVAADSILAARAGHSHDSQ
jgi:hypothetical protein